MSRPSETEQELLRAVEAGEALTLTGRANNVLSAAFIRDLLRSGDFHPRGLMISGARIKGWLDLDYMTTVPLAFTNCVLDDVSMCDAQIPTVDFNQSAVSEFKASNLHTRSFQFVLGRCNSLFDLTQAEVLGDVRLESASIETLRAAGLRVSGNLRAISLYVHTTHRERSAVLLIGCDIGGYVDLDNAIITGVGSHAVHADHARIGSSISARGAILRGAGRALSLAETNAGSLDMTGAVLRSKTNNALCADGAKIRGDVALNPIDAVTQQADATIRMINTSIESSLVIGGMVRNRSGQAVIVERAQVGGGVGIGRVEADSSKAALEVTDTDIGGLLALTPGNHHNRGDGARLNLSNSTVSRELMLNTAQLHGTVTLNGLTYPNPPEDTDAWLAILRDHTSGYEAQPYQQLAAVHRAAGHEHAAREVLIAQQRDLRRRGGLGGWWASRWHWFLGVTLGYGYKPSKAVAGLLATFVLALCLVWTTNAYNGLSPAKDRPADACSPVNRISLAADLAIPLVKLGGTPRCELANGPAGQWATGAGWVVQILGWSFATLSVAGFTGLVRKS